MLTRYKEYRNNIRLNEDDKKYLEIIEQCNSYISELQNNKEDNTNEDFWFAYFTIAKARKNMLGTTDINATIHYIKKSIHYIINENDGYYMSSLWLLGECFVITNCIRQAIGVYNQIIRYYKIHKIYDHRLFNIFNKAKLMNKTSGMLRLINIYKKHSTMEMKNLNSLYEELFDTYIKQSETTKALRLLHTMPDKNFAESLRKKLLAA